ncbi:MAG: hypothetical protein Q9225_007887 [Loekoesia sp. 1 TL-2023]
MQTVLALENSAAPPVLRRQANGVGSSTAAEAFPALPTAAKPSTLMAGLTRGSVKWDDSSRKNNDASPWGNGAIAQAPPPPPPAEEYEQQTDGLGDGEAVVGKKKGKGNKKQTLYKFG